VHAEPLWSFGAPQSDREAGDAVVSNFMLHWFPAKISKASMAWNYSFWLGTISGALFFLTNPLGAAVALPLRALGGARLPSSRTSSS